MDMPKLLIADSNEELRQILFDNLHHSYHMKVCANGSDALEMCRSFQPDIFVLDLTLPGLDGITLLHRLRGEGCHPTVLVTSFLFNGYIINALQQLNVDYLMQKPCHWQAIADRLADLTVQLQPAQYPQGDLSSTISSLLLSMNFSTRQDGFRFLQTAIPLYMRDPDQLMTKELYVAVGQLHNKTANQVERSMRSAIESAWKASESSLWKQYFSFPGDQLPRPSNSDFISRIATALFQQGYRVA